MKEMKKLIVAIAAALVCACLVLTGCSKAYNPAKDEGYYPGSAYQEAPKYDGADSAPGGEAAEAVLANRKVILNASLTVQTLEFDEFIASVNARIAELGGYVQSSDVSGRGYYSSGRNMRSADITARIPAEKLDEFLAAVGEAGNVTSLTKGLDDVTDRYVDIEARLASLRTEYDTLLDLLSKAESLEDIIKLQDRLTDVRYEIETYEGKLRSYDSLIEFSTVTMDIIEVERETPVEEESFGSEVSRRFSESLSDVGEAFRDFGAWFIGNLPAILAVLVIFVALPLIIVLACVKSARKRAARRRLLKEQADREDNSADKQQA